MIKPRSKIFDGAHNIWIIVLRITKGENRGDILMLEREDDHGVLAKIGNLDGDEELIRVFQVDMNGNVIHYAVGFTGRLTLIQLPENGEE